MKHRHLLVLCSLAISLPGLAQDQAASSHQPVEHTDESEWSQAKLLEEVERAESRKILVMIEQPANRLRPGAAYASGYGSAQTKAGLERQGRAIAKDVGLRFVEVWPMPVLGLNCFVLEITNSRSTQEVIELVERQPSVQWAEGMELYEVKAAAAGTDPLAQLSPATSAWNLANIHASWTGRNVTVAVIDTQVDLDHPDLTGRVKVSRNFVSDVQARPEYHGTEVAGIIAANARNGIGSAGVAPEARLMALRACWQRAASRASVCTSLNLARAINYAIENDAKIINLSLGGPTNRLLTRLIDTAAAKGIAVVAAYDPSLPNGGFPASHADVIAVAQTGKGIAKGYAAPGTDVPTTQPGGGFYFVTGSSYAAAHVSGLLALVVERDRNRRVGGAKVWWDFELADTHSRTIDIASIFR